MPPARLLDLDRKTQAIVANLKRRLPSPDRPTVPDPQRYDATSVPCHPIGR